MRFLPLSGGTPVPRRTKLPGVDAKLVSDPSVTVCGSGTTGLGDRCKDAFQDKAAHAFQAWLEYKDAMPPAPLKGSHRSPRERYQTAQRQHEEALLTFQTKQQKTFEILHKEKKEILQRLAKDKVEQLASLSSDILEERAKRKERLDEYLQQKASLARDEKALASALSQIWRAAGLEEELAWESWVAARKRQMDDDRLEFLAAQERQAKLVAQSAASMREQRSLHARKLDALREKEEKARKEDVARLRKSNEESRVRARYAFDEAKRVQVEAFRKEADHWKDTMADRRRAASVAALAHNSNSGLSSTSQLHPTRSNSSMQLSLNAMEEAAISKQRAADAVRAWKRSRSGPMPLTEGEVY